MGLLIFPSALVPAAQIFYLFGARGVGPCGPDGLPLAQSDRRCFIMARTQTLESSPVPVRRKGGGLLWEFSSRLALLLPSICPALNSAIVSLRSSCPPPPPQSTTCSPTLPDSTPSQMHVQ